MSERPIIFSGPMVKAILEGRKTQTRRIIKPQPKKSTKAFWFCISSTDKKSEGLFTPRDGIEAGNAKPTGPSVKCPCNLGERLWVRETWSKIADDHGVGCIYYHADKSATTVLAEDNGDGDWVKLDRPTVCSANDVRKKSPIHMPRWASRITLEVTGVRVERLQDISETDAKAEGCKESVCLPGDCGTFVPDFFNRWAEINGVESYEANPWVWVIEFKKVV